MSYDKEDAIPRGNLQFGSILGGAILIVTLVMIAWSWWQQSRLTTELDQLTADISDVEFELATLDQDQVDSVIVAQQTVEAVDASAIQWSSVISELLSVTPLDVFYRSYTASSNGKMSLSVLTDSYDSAANLISVLEAEEAFSEPFVSSFTKGATDSGSDVVSFGITFNVD